MAARTPGTKGRGGSTSLSRKGPGPAPGVAKKPSSGSLLGGKSGGLGGNHRAPKKGGSGGGAGTLKAAKQRANRSGKSGGNRLGLSPDKKSPAAKQNKPLGAAASLRRLAKAAKSNAGAKIGDARAEKLKPTSRPTAAEALPKREYPKPDGKLRTAGYWAGQKLRRHTSPKTRLRIRKVTSPIRHGASRINRVASPLLARAWRHGSRGFIAAHMALGSIRYSNRGPNWLRPLAKVLHAITTPAARAVAWTGGIGWLNRWMYQHTSDQPARRTASTERPTFARTAGSHTPISRPADAAGPAIGGVPVTNIQPAMPLVNAAEAVRMAGAMLIINPADNMVGYEMTIRQLADLQSAIASVIRAAAASTREDFKVNPAVSEAYDDTAAYMDSIAARLGSIPYLFRVIHAEQIDNIENPTVAAAKWDIGANQQ
ncbi:hypothetical protein [Streptomyces reniochalinae]